MNLLIAAAILPALALMFYVYKKDTVEKEPVGLIVRLFVFGMIAGPLAAILETVAFNFFEALLNPGTLLLILEYFIGVAAVEEGLKYIFLSTVRKNPNFNYVFDGIVYAVAVSLGFAALENVLYVFEGGLEVAVMRAIFSVPGHCADGVIMGCFFGLARQHELHGRKSKATLHYVLAFILPTIEHGFYDAALSADSDILALLGMAFQLAFIVFAAYLVHKISKTDAPVHQSLVQQPPAGTQSIPPQLQQPTDANWTQANQGNPAAPQYPPSYEQRSNFNNPNDFNGFNN